MNNSFRNCAFLFTFILLSSGCNSKKAEEPKVIHQAHLSNDWYPQNAENLKAQLGQYFDLAKKNFSTSIDPNSVKILIAPHAGTHFSGLCAASVYQTLKNNDQKNKKIKKVVILSPTHSKFFQGLALPDYNTYQTALGEIKVNTKDIHTLEKNNSFHIMPEIHNNEHAVEIQLPFLQESIENFEIVPVVIGGLQSQEYDTISKSLKEIIDDSTLVVVSSDFTHYGNNYNYVPFNEHTLNAIRFIDSIALSAINKKSFDDFNKALSDTGSTICGQNAIRVVLNLIQDDKFKNLNPKLSCYYTSAQLEQARNNKSNEIDIKKLYANIPDKSISNSISYMGLAFTDQPTSSIEKDKQLTQYEKMALLESCKQTMQNAFEPEAKKIPEHMLWPICGSGLQKSSGAFVTLNTKDGNLRGCIGRVITNSPLLKTAHDMSLEAAFKDSRFAPVKKSELKDIIVDISVLTLPKGVSSYKDITLGQDGIILKKQLKNNGWAGALFLPQVPKSLGWDLPTTLEQLSLKAGLDKDAWQQDCQFEVFHDFEIKEN